MNVRSKLAALLGAGVLVLGISGLALATSGTTLNAGQVGTTLDGYDKTGEEDCNGVNLDPGQALLHFVLTQSAQDDGSLDVTLSNPSLTPHKDNADVSNAGQNGYLLQWNVIVSGVDGSTVIEGASTDATGNNLNLSHVCFGASESSSSSSSSSSTSSSTSFTGSQSGESSASSSLPDTATLGDTPSPTDHSWMLIAALGMLLGSVLVLAPARAKTRR